MGLTMAPATESVMGSLPLAKASVGSAVNDATRTMGGALGVAVLGSLLSSGYRAGMEGATQGLPAGAAETANQSLAGALAVAQRLGGGAGGRVSEAAQQAFVDGMHTAVLAGAAVAAAGALLTLVALPARAPLAEPAPA
jgi:hypothetical protein